MVFLEGLELDESLLWKPCGVGPPSLTEMFRESDTTLSTNFSRGLLQGFYHVRLNFSIKIPLFLDA